MQFKKLAVLVAGMAAAFAASAGTVNTPANAIYKPTGKGYGEIDTQAMQASGGKVSSGAGTSSLTLHTGDPMTGANHLYFIWYGTAWDSASQSLLQTWGNSIGGSPHFNINSTYYNHSNVHVQNSVTLSGQTSVGYTYGTNLTDANILSIVTNAINSGALPLDVNGQYQVLTDKTVGESSGFCTQYCGWHTHATINGVVVKYAFIGNPEQLCPSACEAFTSNTPNGLPGADGMVSVMTHELEEAVTDPLGNAWYNTSNGQENGDACAWNFGTESSTSTGAKYNQTLGGKNFLIQQNWVIASTQQCLQHYP